MYERITATPPFLSVSLLIEDAGSWLWQDTENVQSFLPREICLRGALAADYRHPNSDIYT